ncbi:MAG: hypothetical protein HY669_00200 [Chloroflexi bacterium]|nr:hypothetical protein [Chloroflexota bacterium]
MKQETGTRKLSFRLKPWTAVMLALAVGMLGYYAVLGVKFLRYRVEERSLNAEVNRLAPILRRPARDIEPLQAQLQATRQKLQDTTLLYSTLSRDHLLSLVANTASDAAVILGRVTFAEAGTESIGDVRYDVQAFDLSISGDLGQFFSFLNLLSQRSPTVKISKVDLGNLQSKPTAQIRTVFYLSPQYSATGNVKQ